MTANQADFPIETMARAMGVSRSGFHAWSRREPSARELADRELLAKIRRIHAASGEVHGAPRIHAELAAEGVHAGRKRVERLMKADGLVGVSRRRSARTTVRDERVRTLRGDTGRRGGRSTTGGGSSVRGD
jgi:putative transposase